MAQTPQLKIYRGKEYIGAVKYAEDAAALVSLYMNGVVKYAHSIVLWREGCEEFSASTSYDAAAKIMNERRELAFKDSYIARHGQAAYDAAMARFQAGA